MTIPSEQILADLDVMWTDWGTTIVIRQPMANYDPQTGTISETPSDLMLTALVGPEEVKPARGSERGHQHKKQTFVVRASDLPASIDLETSRVLFGGREYAIVRTDSRWLNGCVLLFTRSG